jgi:hypothetical protein
MDPHEHPPGGPHEHHPKGSFADAMAEAPPQSCLTGTSFVIELSHNGKKIGYLGRNSGGWGVIKPSGLAMELYRYYGHNYYKVAGEDYYLSASDNAYVGFYHWLGARAWYWNKKNLCHEGRGCLSYLADKEDLYVWNDYMILDVEFKDV